MIFGYLTLELRRSLRAPGTLLFITGFPAVFYLLETMLYEGQEIPGYAGDFSTVVLVSMNAWGMLMTGLFIGGRVVNERAAGWQRQLRLTPLSGGMYLASKVAVGMLVALPTAVIVSVVAVVFEGVRLTLSGWMHVTLYIWLGAIPFAILGLLIGQLANKNNIQSITTITVLLLALLGGLFVPIETLPSWWEKTAMLVPTYWLTEIGRRVSCPATTRSWRRVSCSDGR